MKIALTTDTHYGFLGDKTRRQHELFLKKLSLAIKEEGCVALCHTGDWATHKHSQLEKTFAQFREYIDCPIFTVFGNHDFWNEKNKYKPLPWEKLLSNQDELLKKYNITHVGKNPTVLNNVLFAGFDGWYHHPNPPTNDLKFLPQWAEGENIHSLMNKKAYNDLNNLLYKLNDFQYEKAVCLTHFPPFCENPKYIDHNANPAYLDIIAESFHVLMVGHSHQTQDFFKGNLRILNAGAEYNAPRFIIVEI